MINIVQSNNPEVDSLKCSKCGALWRAKGHYDYDEGGWNYEYGEDLCPCRCKNLFGFRITGKLIKK